MAAKQKTLDDLFLHTLKDIYYAEKQILKALPKMAKRCAVGRAQGCIPDASRADARADRALGAGLRTPGETRARHTLLRAMIGG